MALGDGAETIPQPPTSAPAPKLPRIVQHLVKDFKQELPEDLTDEVVEQSTARSLREYFARASAWRE